MSKPSEQAIKVAERINDCVVHDMIRVRAGGRPQPYDETINALAAFIDSALDEARREQMQTCWHCRVVLSEAVKPRCENCPDECDVEGCDEDGCATAIRKGEG